MDVAIKIMLFQNSPQHAPAPQGDADDPNKGGRKHADTRQLVLREAAVCCSLSHPNVVATYHFEVMEATAFRHSMDLCITDKSGERAYKIYLIQVGHAFHGPLHHRQVRRKGIQGLPLQEGKSLVQLVTLSQLTSLVTLHQLTSLLPLVS